jgi:preprotein translocase subunit SecE
MTPNTMSDKGPSDPGPQAEESGTLEYAGSAPAARGGFFSVYKSGQGYWTRLGTVGAAALLIVFTIYFLWQTVPEWITPLKTRHGLWMGILAALAVGLAALAWHLINKPSNADFLIATDSEMKKVNWTSLKDLWGSTRVVIFFMFFVAITLFMIDLLFGYIFYWMSILKSAPF